MSTVTVLLNTRQRGTGWWRAKLRARETIFHITSDTGRLARFKLVWDTGIRSSLRTLLSVKHETGANFPQQMSRHYELEVFKAR